MQYSSLCIVLANIVCGIRINVQPEGPIDTVRTRLSSLAHDFPHANSILEELISHDTSAISLRRIASTPVVSSVGGRPLCETNFVKNSFTEEELLKTEEHVREWLLGVDDKIESFNNLERIKNNPLKSRLEDESPHQRFEVILPVEGPKCKKDLSVFGENVHDTDKPICNADDMLSKQQDCNLLSIGSHDEWGTEVGMHKMTHCKIHTFDCSTPEDNHMPKGIKDRTTFYKACLGARDETDSDGMKFLSWNSTLKAAGLHDSPDYLKMDIEGFEYGVLRSILRSDSSTLPNQIAMEIHHKTYGPESNNPAGKLSWSGRNKDTGELLGFVLMMYVSGYRLTSVDHETVCAHCLEVLWSKVYC